MRSVPFLLSLFLLLFACRENESNKIPIELVGTWKATAFGNTITGEVNSIAPKDCTDCYTLKLKSDGNLAGMTSTNNISGSYSANSNSKSFKIYSIGGTELNERFDGHKYVEIVYKITKYHLLSKNELHLYYSDSEYLIFKLK